MFDRCREELEAEYNAREDYLSELAHEHRDFAQEAHDAAELEALKATLKKAGIAAPRFDDDDDIPF